MAGLLPGRRESWRENVPAPILHHPLTTIWLARSVGTHSSRRRARFPSRYCSMQAMPAPLSATLRERHRGCGVGHSTRSPGTQALAGESLRLPTAARGPAAETQELFLLCRLSALFRASEHYILRPLPQTRSCSSACSCSRSDSSSLKLNLCSRECAEIKNPYPYQC